MKISKIFAGMSALAIATSMALSVSASTTFTVDDAQTDAWTNVFPQYTPEGADKATDDYIDAKTLTADTALDVTVNFTWLDAEADFVSFKPGFANGWEGFFKIDNSYVTGMKSKDVDVFDDEESGKFKSEDGELFDYAMQTTDGFIIVKTAECTSVNFTISADCVNKMIENANVEDGFDGIIFQVNGGLKITSIDLSQDGVKLASNNQTPADDSSSKADDSSSKADDSSSKAAASSSKAGSTSSTKATSSTTTSSKSDATNPESGAAAGIALAGIALAGAAVVIAKKK